MPLCIDAWTLDLVRTYGAEVPNYRSDAHRVGDRAQLARDIKTAEIELCRGMFYNTYHLDFRGRIYSDQHFNFLRDDRVRSLYRFRYGAFIGHDGLEWLKIHVANTHGKDKLSYAERIKWADQHRADIVSVADDAHGSFKFWRVADKPFAFAAACKELAGALVNPEMITTLPLTFDHSASGLQHLALIRLDEHAATLVNLVDSDKPHDVYAALVERTLELFDHSEEACFWRELFVNPRKARKIIKPLGVSFAYGSKFLGNIRQVYETFEDEYPAEPEPDFAHVRYLVDCFRNACAEKLPRPCEDNGLYSVARGVRQAEGPFFGMGKPERRSRMQSLPQQENVNRLHARRLGV